MVVKVGVVGRSETATKKKKKKDVSKRGAGLYMNVGSRAHLCLTPELPTSITGRDQVNGVKTPALKHDGAQLNSSDDAPFCSVKGTVATSFTGFHKAKSLIPDVEVFADSPQVASR